MKRINLLLCLFCMTLSTQAQQVWLKDVVQTSNRFPDASGNNTDGISEAEQLPATNIINFHYGLHFDGVDDYMEIPYNPDISNELTFISVFRPDHAIDERKIWSANGSKRDIHLTTHQVDGPGGVIYYNGGNVTRPVINTIVQRWEDGEIPVEAAYIAIGNSGEETELPAFKGLIPEYMIFERALDEEERLQVEAYLAIKYGITLSFYDYKTSDKTVIWNAIDNADYYNRIAGIGRDDGFQLKQKQSSSTADNGLLTIGVGRIDATNAMNLSGLNDGDFLVWGDNNLLLTTDEIPSGENLAFSLMQRKWLMDATGETARQLPTEIKLHTISMDLQEGEYPWLIIDRTGNGNFNSNELEYIQLNSQAGEYAFFTGVQWDTDNSGTDAFTFARGPQPVNIPTVDFTVYPNPANGEFNVSIILDEAKDIEASIYDVAGKLIVRQAAENNTRFLFQFKKINVAGAYEVVVETSDARGAQQLIIVE